MDFIIQNALESVVPKEQDVRNINIFNQIQALKYFLLKLKLEEETKYFLYEKLNFIELELIK